MGFFSVADQDRLPGPGRLAPILGGLSLQGKLLAGGPEVEVRDRVVQVETEVQDARGDFDDEALSFPAGLEFRGLRDARGEGKRCRRVDRVGQLEGGLGRDPALEERRKGEGVFHLDGVFPRFEGRLGKPGIDEFLVAAASLAGRYGLVLVFEHEVEVRGCLAQGQLDREGRLGNADLVEAAALVEAHGSRRGLARFELGRWPFLFLAFEDRREQDKAGEDQERKFLQRRHRYFLKNLSSSAFEFSPGPVSSLSPSKGVEPSFLSAKSFME